MRRSRRTTGLLITALVLAACGGDDPVAPDVEIADLVGDWDASAMVFSNPLDPEQRIDIIEIGADFFLNVQPSGGYTSSIAFEGQSATELGQLEIDGDRLIFHVQVAFTGPRVDTAQFELDGDVLTFEGRTIFDFDLNGISEFARLEATLVR